MSKPAADVLEREKDKLYLTDAELIRRLGVPTRDARAAIQELEARSGFPKKEAIWGNRRYWPAVRAWLDARYGISTGPDKQPSQSRSRYLERLHNGGSR